MERFFLFDIETVPDVPVVARFPAKTQAAAIPPPIANQVVAISYLLGRVEDSGRAVRMSIEQCGSFCDELSPEVTLLEAFWKRVGADSPLLVTWNGRGFDVPVLLHRSLLHGVTARLWFEHGAANRYRSYAYRYGDRHIDLTPWPTTVPFAPTGWM
jgi:predicted PolB exonuclease-like 3'-5' exonuclease